MRGHDSVEILSGDIHLVDLQTRLPFRYGMATMTEAPHAFVRLRVRDGDREATGIAADHLPPKWFTKDPDASIASEIDEMLRTLETAVGLSEGRCAKTPFDLWCELSHDQAAWGRLQGAGGWPPLLVNFGMTLVERAMLEAVARARGLNWQGLLHGGGLGIRLGDCDERLADADVAGLLPTNPPPNVIARQTVGLADPLGANAVSEHDRLNDGLPETLQECLEAYGLFHLKIKVQGDWAADRERLLEIDSLVTGASGASRSRFRFTLDANEQFRDLGAFRDYWGQMASDRRLAAFLSGLLFVEQPIHRSVALDADVMGCDGGLASWSERPPIIIDESDAEPDSLARALALGYDGTSHKNCKGVFRGVVNACLLSRLNRDAATDQRPRQYIMSGEDLVNICPVALPQDLAVAASLGVESIERNGHHYFAGLSVFPDEMAEQALAAHPDLLGRSRDGWPAVLISEGRMSLESVRKAPLGVGFELDVDQFESSAEWRRRRGIVGAAE
tara:strand:+ start:427 stop:1938 length:1512 start_codon:yes stop_codon:yes gene_type:complete